MMVDDYDRGYCALRDASREVHQQLPLSAIQSYADQAINTHKIGSYTQTQQHSVSHPLPDWACNAHCQHPDHAQMMIAVQGV